jgi:Rod binding domain-containing protein
MSTIINSPLNSPLLGPPNVPSTLGPVNTAANRFEAPNFGVKDELKETFTQFVGETFFGQLIKSMRSTVGKPAYFHGGQAEEAFQGQLDQQLAEHLTKASADKFAEPLFRRQFPHLAEQSAAQPGKLNTALSQLQSLPRR